MLYLAAIHVGPEMAIIITQDFIRRFLSKARNLDPLQQSPDEWLKCILKNDQKLQEPPLCESFYNSFRYPLQPKFQKPTSFQPIFSESILEYLDMNDYDYPIKSLRENEEKDTKKSQEKNLDVASLPPSQGIK